MPRPSESRLLPALFTNDTDIFESIKSVIVSLVRVCCAIDRARVVLRYHKICDCGSIRFEIVREDELIRHKSVLLQSLRMRFNAVRLFPASRSGWLDPSRVLRLA
jgi:hypothetical protein